jgi:hypothetical protein
VDRVGPGAEVDGDLMHADPLAPRYRAKK